MWVNVSRAADQALSELLAEDYCHMKTTAFLTYLVDGITLNLPIAKQRRKYKTPHWLPVVFNLGP